MSSSNPGSNPFIFFCPIVGPPYPTHTPPQKPAISITDQSIRVLEGTHDNQAALPGNHESGERRKSSNLNCHAPITGRPVMLHYLVHSPTSSYVHEHNAIMNNSKKYDFDNDIIFLGPPKNMILEYKCSMSLGQVCMALKIGQPIYRSQPIMNIEGVGYYPFRASLIGKLHGIHHSAVGAYAPSEDLAREDAARKLLTRILAATEIPYTPFGIESPPSVVSRFRYAPSIDEFTEHDNVSNLEAAATHSLRSPSPQIPQRMSRLVTVIMHHGGKLMRNEDNGLDYIRGEVDVWEDLDSDYINSLEDGLRELRWDCDTNVLDMCIASMRNDGEIEVFIEHLVVENPTFSKSRADVGEKERAENVKEKDESGFVHEENEAAENLVGNDEEGFVNEQNVVAEETNEGGMDVPAEGEHVGDAAVEDHNDLPIPEEDNGSNFSDEEVEVEMGFGSSIRRKRAQSSDDMMSSDETDYGSEELSDQDNDDEDAQPVENFEVVAASMQIDDEEVEED
ncbi:hypothetical protein SESBI_48982, partial [Sesbania bispinosa]